jgi:hypothetical protein
MSLAIVQGSVTLGAAPTAGNIIVAYLGVNIAAASLTIATANWTVLDKIYQNDAISGGNLAGVLVYRYVVGGDAAALPAFCTAGSTFWAHQIWEVSGVTGAIATDLLFSFDLYNVADRAAIAAMKVPVAGMALTAIAAYNTNTDPSINGSWSTDNTAHNALNFGSCAGAHRSMSAGNTLDGTWTVGTSSPQAAVVLFLCASQPSRPWIRHTAMTVGNSFPGSVTVPWTPLVGSLLLCILAWDQGTGANPTITGSWTDLIDATITTKSLLVLYRYVQGGDTNALAAVASAGAQFYSATFIEIAGATGVIGTDIVSKNVGAQASGASITTAADSTTANSQFVLYYFANYSGTANLALPTGIMGWLVSGLNNSNYGSWAVGMNDPALSSTSIGGIALTTSASASPASYAQIIFGAAAGGGGTASGGRVRTFPNTSSRTFPNDVGRDFPTT